ncbi:MAG TPA: DUF3226 domain-containing protein [Bryobacteraceae bacterium]|jgi:hypothetical protein
MGTNKSNPKQLVVEGFQDLYSVHGLMRAHIDWPDGKENAPVWIEIGKSAEEILEPGYISLKLKEPFTETLGVILDADTSPRGRYGRIRKQSIEIFPDLPDDIPLGGLIVENDDHKRLGVWIMPDNASEGCLEVFLRHLVPNESEPIWQHATGSVVRAREIGASCRECHLPKAFLYTWLAWQDEPGQYPGTALTRRILDPHAVSAASFVKWFRELYAL